MVETSCAETAFGTFSVLKSCYPWIPAADKDAFRPCSCSVDIIDLSINEVENPVSHIANPLRLWFSFTSFLRTTGSPPCVIIVATAVVASEAPVLASFFEKWL